MNPPTKSELLFQKYCAQQLYSVEKIQTEENKRTPDFIVATPLDKKLRLGQGQEISAVCLLLSDDAENYPPCIYVFHNVFAKTPLPRQIFQGSNDKHFRNPVNGNTFQTDWVELGFL